MKLKSQIKKKFIIFFIILTSNSSCNSLDPEIKINNYNKTNSDKIILFPTFADQKNEYNEDAKKVHLNISKDLKKIEGLNQIIYGGLEVRKIADSVSKNLYHEITLDLLSNSGNSSLKNSKTFKIFLKKIYKKFGNYNFMIINISGNQDDFLNNKEVALIIGMYDTKKLNWIYKIKISYSRSKINNWLLMLDILSSEAVKAISQT